MSKDINAEILKERLIKNITLTNAIDRSFNEAPSIDIVRCRECIFDTDYYFKNDVKEHRHEWCYEFCDVDGYCPFGKKQSRREGE